MRKNYRTHLQTAQGLVEYALIIAVVSVALILVLQLTGTSVESIYCQALGEIGGQGCGCQFDFENQNELDQWEGKNPNGYFSVEDGKACMTSDGSARSFLNSCPQNNGTDDFTMAVNGVTFEKAGSGNVGFDVWFRAQDDQNGYHFTYNASTHLIRFWKQVNGKWIQLATKKVPSSWASEENNFRVSVIGDTFTAYREDIEILQASDDTFQFEKVGLRNKPGSKTCLDTMVIEAQ